MKIVKVATRGSKLAVTQTNWAIDRLKAANPDTQFETVIIKTRGDRGDLSVMGAFIKELEHALLEGKVDLAIHSLKDLPTEIPEGLLISCIPPREDARDVLISKNNLLLDKMSAGSVIGTGSPRRIHQIKAINPSVEVVHIRGNIDSRIGYVDKGEVDAVVLAAAGVHRLGMHDRISEYLDPVAFVPAPGQGALALQVRENDAGMLDLTQKIHDKATAFCVEQERRILAGVGGGCQLPIGAYVTMHGSCHIIRAFYGLKADGTLNRTKQRGNIADLEIQMAALIKQIINENVMHEG